MRIKLNDKAYSMNYNGTTVTFTEEQYIIIKYLVNNNYELNYEKFKKDYNCPSKNALQIQISRINKKLGNMLFIKGKMSKEFRLLVSPKLYE